MANEKNLTHTLTVSELRKGGKNSAKARKDKKVLKDCFELLLEGKREMDGKTLTGAEAMALTLFEKALGGDVKAAEFVRDTAGQKPVEKVVIADVDPTIIDEVESMVLGDYDAE